MMAAAPAPRVDPPEIEDPETPPQLIATNDAARPPEPVKRGRGRPPKNLTPEQRAAAERERQRRRASDPAEKARRAAIYKARVALPRAEARVQRLREELAAANPSTATARRLESRVEKLAEKVAGLRMSQAESEREGS